MSDLDSFLAVPQSTHQRRQPKSILKSRTKRTENNQMEEKIKPSSTASTRQTQPTSFSKTTIAKQNGDKAVEINLNIQLPSMPPSESATYASNEINDLRELIKKQTHQIQSLQIKIDAFEIKDAEKMLEIQTQNYEIQSLKNSIKNQTENYLFILDSNSKLWSAVNNLEKQITSNISASSDTKKINADMEKEIETSKEILFMDIKKYLIENPNRAKDVEEMAKNLQRKQQRKILMVDEYDKKFYRKKMEENNFCQKIDKLYDIADEMEKMQMNKNKNIQNWFINTVDDKLENDIEVSRNARPDIQKSNHHRSPSPTNSIISVSSCESDFECSSYVDEFDEERMRYLIDVTLQSDRYSNNSWSADETLPLYQNISSSTPATGSLDVEEINDRINYDNHDRDCTGLTEQPDQFQRNLIFFSSQASIPTTSESSINWSDNFRNDANNYDVLETSYSVADDATIIMNTNNFNASSSKNVTVMMQDQYDSDSDIDFSPLLNQFIHDSNSENDISLQSTIHETSNSDDSGCWKTSSTAESRMRNYETPNSYIDVTLMSDRYSDDESWDT